MFGSKYLSAIALNTHKLYLYHSNNPENRDFISLANTTQTAFLTALYLFRYC